MKEKRILIRQVLKGGTPLSLNPLTRLPFLRADRAVRMLLCVSIIPLLIGVACLAFGIRFTWTASLPPGLYRTVDAPLTHGVLVSVCLPDTLIDTAWDRGYGNPGFCPGGLAPLLKEVAAMPGDTVRVESSGLTVNGIPITRTQRRDLDSEGRPIPMIKVGIYTVGDSELWLISNYRSRSWDSRYFGPLHSDRVQSVMQPLLVWN